MSVFLLCPALFVLFVSSICGQCPAFHSSLSLSVPLSLHLICVMLSLFLPLFLPLCLSPSLPMFLASFSSLSVGISICTPDFSVRLLSPSSLLSSCPHPVSVGLSVFPSLSRSGACFFSQCFLNVFLHSSFFMLLLCQFLLHLHFCPSVALRVCIFLHLSVSSSPSLSCSHTSFVSNLPISVFPSILPSVSVPLFQFRNFFISRNREPDRGLLFCLHARVQHLA